MARYHTITVGNAELVALQDSWTTREPGGFFYGIEAPAWEPYRAWLNPDGLLAHNFGCFLIRSRGQNILVDTGLGQWPNPLDLVQPPALLDVLGHAGTPPDAIDLVLFTHLHWDHTGWNTVGADGAFEPAFPNARYVVQRREFEYWTSPGDKPPAGADFDKVLDPVMAAGLLDLVDEEYEATREVIAVPTPGHTPGHVSFGIESGGAFAYILGDAAHKPVQLSEPDWYPGFDMDPVESTRSRNMILDRAERENAILAGGHFEFPSMGYPTHVDGKRSFAYVPGGREQP
ncbi:MAG: MBL fold metallo-hydrolase [Acidimicrobiia bacterium]|nr:MBL fold metallo-hydrolase [Acidimicrobiia bacterium]